MLSNTKLAILIALALVIVAVIGLKQVQHKGIGEKDTGLTPVVENTAPKPVPVQDEIQAPPLVETQVPVKPPEPAPAQQAKTPKPSSNKLPRLVDLGRGTCIPCKKMAPILEELAKEYKNKMQVDVIDLRDKPEAATEYKIELIPTQIFFDPSGKEIYRHQGFIAKEEILAKWKELGFTFSE